MSSKQSNNWKTALASGSLVVISVGISLLFGEAVLRAKNSSMDNYDVEMWRYANTLKQKSDNEVLDFVHTPSKSAVLQKKTVSLNQYGLRGPEVEREPQGRRILFLGGSITLGWGVDEDKVTTSVVSEILNKNNNGFIEVLNAGVGNYNASRYTERFFKQLTELQPTDIVVQYFLRDAEDLQPSQENPLLSNSQLALTLWILKQRTFGKSGDQTISDHYQKVYEPNSPGLIKMEDSLKKLSAYAQANNIKLFMLMTPDIHDLENYKFDAIHQQMEEFANNNGFVFVDALPNLRNIPATSLYAMPGDPHPNALGHKIMAETIAPVLQEKNNN